MVHVGVYFKAKAFGDDRFDVLGRVLGLADGDHARGKMLRLWDVCARTQHYTVSRLIVETVLGARGVEALVTAELAELVPQHMATRWAEPCGLVPAPAPSGEMLVRLRGTDGAIERHGQRIVAASKGGLERARRAGERNAGKFTASRPAGVTAGSTDGLAAGDAPVDNAVKKLLSGVPDDNRDIHSNQPTSWSHGNPTAQPPDQPLTRASEIRSEIQISESDQKGGRGGDRKPARVAAPGLRVIAGGGDAAEGGS
jgi:hypothetical protein